MLATTTLIHTISLMTTGTGTNASANPILDTPATLESAAFISTTPTLPTAARTLSARTLSAKALSEAAKALSARGLLVTTMDALAILGTLGLLFLALTHHLSKVFLPTLSTYRGG